MKTHEEEKMIFEKSSGNVFRDLELPDAEERLEKSNLAVEISRTIIDRGLTQREAAEIMGIDQPKVSAVIRGNLKGFSLERLIGLCKKLGVDVHIAKKTDVPDVQGPANPSSSDEMIRPDELDLFNWNEMIDSSQEKKCAFYSDLLRKKASRLKEEGESGAARAFELLADLAMMRFVPGDKTDPYQPVFRYQGKRSMVPSDLTENELTFLTDLVPEIGDPELKARISDVVWLGTRNYGCAQTAVESFLRSAENLEKTERWSFVSQRLERAFRLARSIRNIPLSKKVKDRIDNLIQRRMDQGDLHSVGYLMDILAESRYGDPVKYANMVMALAEKMEKANDFDAAKRMWNLSGTWWQFAGKKDEARTARLRSAETNVRKADFFERSEKPNHLLISAFLEQAVQEYRRIGGEKNRVKVLHARLLESQRKSIKEMKTVSAPIRFPQGAVDRGVNLVMGKTFGDALGILSRLVTVPSKARLRKEVENQIKAAPLLHLMSATILDSSGKVVRKRSSLQAGDTKEVEDAMRVHLVSQARFHRGLSGVLIDAARQQILLEHPVSEEDWDFLIIGNPFVPAGREKIFAKGLHSGLMGDFLVATHLLIPQLENFFRKILESRGVDVTKTDNEGIQQSINLQEALSLQEFKDIFGEDVAFDLQGLLVEHGGPNLRNDTSHGLRNHESFFSPDDTYLWWSVLRLCWIFSRIGT